MERRAARVPGYTLEVGADITRHLPHEPDDEALLWLPRFARSDADRRIAEELASVRNRGWQAEWKLHDFDEPEDLKLRLEAHGLSCHQTEALMVLDVANTVPRTFTEMEVRVKRASTEEIDEIASVGEHVWNVRLPWLAKTLREEFRGRGIYSRLFEARVAEARSRGVPYIAVDAAPMSRPILERFGFRFVCNTYPMRTRAYEPLCA